MVRLRMEWAGNISSEKSIDMVRGWILVAAIFCIVGSVQKVGAQGVPSPESLIESRYAEIEKLLASEASEKEVRLQIMTLMDSFVDFEELSRLTIKTHWAELSSRRQKEFVDLFKQLVQRSYAKRFKKDRKFQVSYEGEPEIRKGRARLKTTVSSGETIVDVEYRLHMPAEKSGWWVYDLVIDDVSLMRNYRKQFYDILMADGVDVLFQKLRDRVVTGGE